MLKKKKKLLQTFQDKLAKLDIFISSKTIIRILSNQSRLFRLITLVNVGLDYDHASLENWPIYFILYSCPVFLRINRLQCEISTNLFYSEISAVIYFEYLKKTSI